MQTHPIAVAGLALLASASAALAGPTGVATRVLEFNQGRHHDSSRIDLLYSDPENALGAPESTNAMNYVSLGARGSITLGFDAAFAGSVTVWETTYNAIPGEFKSAAVEVGHGDSLFDAQWWNAGVVTNLTDGAPIDLAPIADLAGRETFTFLRITDTTPNSSTADRGFALDGVTVGLPSSPVPTPASASLLALGGLAAARRRR